MRFAVLLAVLALAASPGASRAEGPDTAMVTLGAGSSGTRAFVAWPAGKGPFSGVVVVHEWWGLSSHIREMARRLAREGHVAIVPDLYHGEVATDAEQAHVLSRGLDEKPVLADLNSAVAWLRTQERVGRKKIGVIGFCMGGGYAQSLAIENPEIAAVVVFYGRPETDPARLARLRGPLLGHFGEADKAFPAERVEALRAGLLQAKKQGEVHLYHGAGHAFMNDARPSFHPDAAKQAWARTLAFLHKHLKR